MSSSSRPVRTRIAPSPTGDPHIGTAYQTLFDYVLARKFGGQMIVRIEDTDQTRYRKDSEVKILEALKWLGLQWDEGPDVGGPFGPYRQSERLPLYRKEAEHLIEKGHAYRCFCSSERLEALRKEQVAAKSSTIGYDRHCRDLSPQEVQRNLDAGKPYVIRMKMPLHGKTAFHDGLRGIIEFENAQMDDQVLLKTDGFPTYHLGVVVDDHHMQISHVIRGEEWISSAPKHVILYDMFGWEKPEFYHMNLLRNADKSKISKRKNPTSILYYKRKGILPEVLLNYLALMGWNPGNDREIFSIEEMIREFTWDRFTVSGPVFDLQKLAWLNGQYLRKMADDDYVRYIRDEIMGPEYLKQIVPLVRERVEKFEDFIPYAAFFFAGDLTYDRAIMIPKGKSDAEVAVILSEMMDALENIDEWTRERIQAAIEGYNQAKGYKPKDTYMPMRVAVTGKKESPGLFETIEVLGKEIVRRRVRLASAFLASGQG